MGLQVTLIKGATMAAETRPLLSLSGYRQLPNADSKGVAQ